MAAGDLKTVQAMWALSPAHMEHGFLCGVEYEVEQIRNLRAFKNEKAAQWPDFINITDDSSLREYGKELITVPMNFDDQLEWFDIIHNELLEFYENRGSPYSERTSTHVHVNMKPLIMLKVAQFVKLYILFEPYFFSLVDEKRKNNIYCVPLNYTFLPKHYSTNITYQHSRWSKYTAFNILPLSTFGTIEFRHLQGTGDKEVFKKWLLAIKKLYDFNVTYNVDFPKVINKEEGVKKLFSDIFEDSFPIEVLNDTIIDLKLGLQKLNSSVLSARISKLKGDS